MRGTGEIHAQREDSGLQIHDSQIPGIPFTRTSSTSCHRRDPRILQGQPGPFSTTVKKREQLLTPFEAIGGDLVNKVLPPSSAGFLQPRWVSGLS